MLLERIFENCALHELTVRGDDRGRLVAVEAHSEIDIEIGRVYYIFGTQAGVARGFHAHRELKQWAICVAGSCRLVLDDGRTRRDVLLDKPTLAIELPPLLWHEMHDFSSDAVLLVLASAPYDEADYIRSYQEFVTVTQARRSR